MVQLSGRGASSWFIAPGRTFPPSGKGPHIGAAMREGSLSEILLTHEAWPSSAPAAKPRNLFPPTEPFTCTPSLPSLPTDPQGRENTFRSHRVSGSTSTGSHTDPTDSRAMTESMRSEWVERSTEKRSGAEWRRRERETLWCRAARHCLEEPREREQRERERARTRRRGNKRDGWN